MIAVEPVIAASCGYIENDGQAVDDLGAGLEHRLGGREQISHDPLPTATMAGDTSQRSAIRRRRSDFSGSG